MYIINLQITLYIRMSIFYVFTFRNFQVLYSVDVVTFVFFSKHWICIAHMTPYLCIWANICAYGPILKAKMGGQWGKYQGEILKTLKWGNILFLQLYCTWETLGGCKILPRVWEQFVVMSLRFHNLEKPQLGCPVNTFIWARVNFLYV